MTTPYARVMIIRRDDPAQPGRKQIFRVPFVPGKTVQQVLMELFQDRDRTLAFRRYRCNRGVCGACVVKVNGKPRLACSTPMTRNMTLEPAEGHPGIKDLAVELG